MACPTVGDLQRRVTELNAKLAKANQQTEKLQRLVSLRTERLHELEARTARYISIIDECRECRTKLDRAPSSLTEVQAVDQLRAWAEELEYDRECAQLALAEKQDRIESLETTLSDTQSRLTAVTARLQSIQRVADGDPIILLQGIPGLQLDKERLMRKLIDSDRVIREQQDTISQYKSSLQVARRQAALANQMAEQMMEQRKQEKERLNQAEDDLRKQARRREQEMQRFVSGLQAEVSQLRESVRAERAREQTRVMQSRAIQSNRERTRPQPQQQPPMPSPPQQAAGTDWAAVDLAMTNAVAKLDRILEREFATSSIPSARAPLASPPQESSSQEQSPGRPTDELEQAPPLIRINEGHDAAAPQDTVYSVPEPPDLATGSAQRAAHTPNTRFRLLAEEPFSPEIASFIQRPANS